MARALVIGGAGFIGSHLVRVCLDQSCEVCVYDNFSTGRREFLPADSNLHIIEGDILKTIYLSNAMDEFSPDIVFHLAAIHHIPTCERIPTQALRVNVEGTQSVLSAIIKHRGARIIFASTGGLYDSSCTGPLGETFPVRAQDIYAISKFAGERLLQRHVSKYDGRAIIARLFNAAGRRETNPHLIPSVMAQLTAGERHIRLGNLYPRRDYVHVEDAAEALFRLGRMPMEQPIEIFNIGSGQEFSVRELVELCSKVISEPLEIVSIPELRRKMDRPSQLADLTKIKQMSAWKPKRTLEQALSEIWQENLEKTFSLQKSGTL